MASISLDSVAVVRHGHPVLVDVSLDVADGEAVALLGASGSGKTTILRVIAGLEELSAGTVTIGGRDMQGVPTRDRDLAMVPQGAPMHDHLDVTGNLEFPLRIRRVEAEERRRRVGAELKAFMLGRFARKRPSTLSSGERHAASMAHALVRPPSALLMDEPSGGLDPDNRRRVIAQVGTVRAGYGATLLVATNERRVAATLADRVAVVEGGRIAQVAPFQALYESPATLGVADLTGAWVLARLPARVRPVPGEQTRLVTGLGTLSSWNPALQRGPRRVTVAIRPEELTVVDDGPLHARVVALAPVGHTVNVVLEGEGEALSATARPPGPRLGEVVALAPTGIHVFDDRDRALAHG